MKMEISNILLVFSMIISVSLFGQNSHVDSVYISSVGLNAIVMEEYAHESISQENKRNLLKFIKKVKKRRFVEGKSCEPTNGIQVNIFSGSKKEIWFIYKTLSSYCINGRSKKLKMSDLKILRRCLKSKYLIQSLGG